MKKIVNIVLITILLNGCTLKTQIENIFKEKEKTEITQSEFDQELKINKQEQKDLRVLIFTDKNINYTIQNINIKNLFKNKDQFIKEVKVNNEQDKEELFEFMTDFARQTEQNLDKKVYVYIEQNNFANQLSYFKFLKDHGISRNVFVKTITTYKKQK